MWKAVVGGKGGGVAYVHRKVRAADDAHNLLVDYRTMSRHNFS